MTDEIKNDNLSNDGLVSNDTLETKDNNSPAPQDFDVRDEQAKPEGLPDDFWDEEKKSLKTSALIEGYKQKEKIATDLRRIISTKGSALPPSKPEEYKIEVKDNELAVFVKDDNPLVASARKAALEAGLSTEQFNKFINRYLGEQKEKNLLSQPEPVKTPEQLEQERKEYYDSEMTKLGNTGKVHFEEFNTVIRDGKKAGSFNDKDVEIYKDIMYSADHVRFMKKFITVYSSRPSSSLGVPSDTIISEGMLTREELAAMGADPRMQTDPAFRAKRDAGYRALEAAGKL